MKIHICEKTQGGMGELTNFLIVWTQGNPESQQLVFSQLLLSLIS